MSSVKLRYSVVCLMFSELKKPPLTTSPLAISTSNIDFLVNSFASKLALSNAFFDVMLKEPIKDKKLLNLKNFYLTPHLAGSTIEIAEAASTDCAQKIVNFFE